MMLILSTLLLPTSHSTLYSVLNAWMNSNFIFLPNNSHPFSLYIPTNQPTNFPFCFPCKMLQEIIDPQGDMLVCSGQDEISYADKHKQNCTHTHTHTNFLTTLKKMAPVVTGCSPSAVGLASKGTGVNKRGKQSFPIDLASSSYSSCPTYQFPKNKLK